MEFTLNTTIDATPTQIYQAWLSSEGHTNMTGGKAKASDKVGGKFTSWDGYICGENIFLEKNHIIKQTWRSSQFEASKEDSILEIILKKQNGGTELTLIHSNIPENGEHYIKGWDQHYFQPMKSYFSKIKTMQKRTK